jgi:hypothetical protein
MARPGRAPMKRIGMAGTDRISTEHLGSARQGRQGVSWIGGARPGVAGQARQGDFVDRIGRAWQGTMRQGRRGPTRLSKTRLGAAEARQAWYGAATSGEPRKGSDGIGTAGMMPNNLAQAERMMAP